MQKSYVVKSPINFANFGFFVRVGDILVHDPANGNRLTVYRGGEIVKAITQTALGMSALLKQGFVTELTAPQPAAAVPTPPKAPEAPKKPAPVIVKPEPKIDKEALRTEIKKKAKAAVQEETSLPAPKDEVEEL